MAVPELFDMNKLVSLGAADPTNGVRPLVCSGSDLHRYHYDLVPSPIRMGEPFTMGAVYKLDKPWKGGTLLRADTYPGAAGTQLFRCEIDAMSSGAWKVVRNQHSNQGGSSVWQAFLDVPMLPANKLFRLDMHLRLGTKDGQALTIVFLDGVEVSRSTLPNWVPGGESVGMTRPRFGIVDRGTLGGYRVEIYEAYVTAKVPGGAPAPTPTPTDWEAKYNAAQAQLAVANRRADDAERKISAARTALG